MMKRIRRNRGRLTAAMVLAVAAAALALHGLADSAGLFAATMQNPDTWRGLAVAPEHRCAPYNRADYPYPQSIEARIVGAQGGVIYGPYSGRLFRSTFETDIDTSLPSPKPMTAACAPPMPKPGGASPPTCSILPWPAQR